MGRGTRIIEVDVRAGYDQMRTLVDMHSNSPKFLTLLALSLLIGMGSASAGTITTCGASSGHRYNLTSPNPYLSYPKGWASDGISAGSFELIQDGEDYDIITRDAVGSRSSKADGAIIVRADGDIPGVFVILAAYNTGTVEHFLFELTPQGEGQVVWGTVRPMGSLPKSSLMQAKCRKPR
jgi:hypothetical protein